MDTVRYVLAVLMVILTPPAVAYWFAIHPFVGFWRRLGTKPALTVLWAGFIAAIRGCWSIRDVLVGRDLGTSTWLFVPGLALYLVAAVLSRAVSRQLTMRILVGVPELDAGPGPGRLLREGIYGRVRHPRYAAFLIGCVGIALIVNYVGVYVMSVLLFPALHVVAIIEERELRARFGADYEAYSAEVPRLVPRLRGG
jgi:protein-S-isoprenylcysteine O-methyltransferase Ste14